MNTLSLMDRRRRAAELLSLVLEEAITANYALAQWPALPPGDLPDESLDVAYQALWHFATGDPSQYEFDPFYLDVQIEVLRTVAALLYRGQPLPADMLAAYRGGATDGQAPRFYQSRKSWGQDLGAVLGNTVRRGFQEYREAVGLLADLIGNKRRSGHFLPPARAVADPIQEPMTALFGLEPPPPLFAEPKLNQLKSQLVPSARPSTSKVATASRANVAVSAASLTSSPSEDGEVTGLPSVMFQPFPASFPPQKTVASFQPLRQAPVESQQVERIEPIPQPTSSAPVLSQPSMIEPQVSVHPIPEPEVVPALRPAALIPQPVGTLTQPLPTSVQAGRAGFARQQPGAITRSSAASLQFSALNERNAFVLSRRFPNESAADPNLASPLNAQTVLSA